MKIRYSFWGYAVLAAMKFYDLKRFRYSWKYRNTETVTVAYLKMFSIKELIRVCDFFGNIV